MGTRKNKHAVALGKLGGAAGKGSPARKRAARRAAKIRWRNHKAVNICHMAGRELSEIEKTELRQHYKNIMKKDLTTA